MCFIPKDVLSKFFHGPPAIGLLVLVIHLFVANAPVFAKNAKKQKEFKSKRLEILYKEKFELPAMKAMKKIEQFYSYRRSQIKAQLKKSRQDNLKVAQASEDASLRESFGSPSQQHGFSQIVAHPLSSRPPNRLGSFLSEVVIENIIFVLLLGFALPFSALVIIAYWQNEPGANKLM